MKKIFTNPLKHTIKEKRGSVVLKKKRRAEEIFQIKGNRKHDNQWQCVILDLG